MHATPLYRGRETIAVSSPGEAFSLTEDLLMVTPCHHQTTKRIVSGWLLAKEYSSCRRVRLFAGNQIETECENSVDGEQQHPLEPVRLTVAHDLAADAHRQYYGQ